MDMETEGDGTGTGTGSKLLDRSKVRILLCDPDHKSSQEVLCLLSNCSYQVTNVKSARQVIDVLNRQADEIDLILAEVDLPFAKGFKMLKYIARNKNLARIPIIMMSAQDEVSVVVKCLRLGAADYLVKPLRMNELLNLWTHMWRRRRMLGLSEKDIFAHEFSDPSDANTNSTTLMSDDTTTATAATKDNANQDTGITNRPDHEFQCNVSPSGIASKGISENRKSDDLTLFSGKTDLRVGQSSGKTDLRIGQSSAFLAYVRSNSTATQQVLELNQSGYTAIQIESSPEQNNPTATEVQESAFYDQNTLSTAGPSSSSGNEMQQMPMYHLPMYYPGVTDQGINVNLSVMPPQTMQIFQNGHHHHHQYNMFHQYTHQHIITPPPFHYPNNNHHMIQQQQQQQQNVQMWSTMAAAGSNADAPPDGTKGTSMERRAAALVKFRQKRKERCFDKKIRYINRKKLAETRPRVRGQFVRHEVTEMDLNFVANSEEENENEVEEEEEEEEPTSISREMYNVSSPDQ